IVPLVVQSCACPVRSTYWLGFAPPFATPDTFTGSVPVLVTVEVCAVVAPAASSLDPNARVDGLLESTVSVPSPLRLIVMSGSSVVSITTEPDLTPLSDGSKLARTLQFAPPARVAPQSAASPVSRVKPE